VVGRGSAWTAAGTPKAKAKLSATERGRVERFITARVK